MAITVLIVEVEVHRVALNKLFAMNGWNAE
jgi:hypothetical protein